MSLSRHSPPSATVQLAMEHVRRVAQQCRESDSPVLPRLDQLAADAGVSRMTMWRAVGLLRDEGLLAAGRGRRILLASYAAARADARAAAPAPERTRDQSVRVEREVRHALVDGEYSTDEALPSIKELCIRHRASYWVVRRALGALCESGELEHRGRTYQRPGPLVSPTNRAVVLIAWGLHGRLNMVSSRTQDQLRHLENECSRLGLRLVTCSHDTLLDPELARTFERDMRRLQPLGYVLFETGVGGAHCIQIISLLRRLKAPVAVLTESWDGPPFAGPQHGNEPAAWFKLGVNEVDGERMGRYLYALGHRHVAFVSTDHSDGSGHSFVRWQGLKKVFGGMKGTSTAELLVIELGSFGVRDLNFASAVRQTVDLLHDPTLDARSRGQRQLLSASRGFTSRIHALLTSMTQRSDLRDALTQLHAHPGITCWVGDNDITALACLDFLNAKGIRVPGELSIAGFDDGLRSLMAGLTSYNFGGAETMRAIMTFITRPHQPLPPGPVQASGRVVVRTTTAPPQ